MMRATLLGLAVALAACSQPAPQAHADLPDCSALQIDGDLNPAECQMEAAGSVVRVTYAPLAAGMQTGSMQLTVLDSSGQPAQTLLESGVEEYRAPQVQDIDGDGRADFLIARLTGNVNTEWGVWINTGDRYQRAGEISGVEVQRTAEGYIAVPARSSCCSWNVRYYTLDQAGLHDLVTVEVDGEEETPDGRIRSTCTISEAPGLAALRLDASAAREKFCAEPASQVYEQ